MIKGVNVSGGHTIIDAPNTATKYIKYKLTEMKGEADNSTI